MSFQHLPVVTIVLAYLYIYIYICSNLVDVDHPQGARTIYFYLDNCNIYSSRDISNEEAMI